MKKLPIGIEDYADFKKRDYYYIDKTGMIKDLLDHLGKVNLFTRPRRFGKSLTMSMLKYFFEIGTDSSLFDGLDISKERELCENYMGKYPVISLTLKQVDGFNFDHAKEQLWVSIRSEARRFGFLEKSDQLSEDDCKVFHGLVGKTGNLESSLYELSQLLYQHYHRKVIILIDEYDVPLQKANIEGYYKEMAKFISQFFGYGMKTNPYMEFAVVTGCLRIAKESIFTGFNNPKIYTIVNEMYDEWFGFTDDEVQKLLADYGKSKYYQVTKDWYDGYQFGKTKVYCPWDVMNFCDQLSTTSDDRPQNFWANSSGNDIIIRFAELADEQTRIELEELLQGKSVWKQINFELTYVELEETIENLWSVLFMTGYLTFRNRDDKNQFELILPNHEIKLLFEKLIERWFKQKIKNDTEGLTDFFEAMDMEDAEQMEDNLNILMDSSISYMDAGKQKEKENFYHGMVLGILNARKDWVVKSNREAGNGRLDLLTYYKRAKVAYIFEFKYAEKEQELESLAQDAVEQIKEKHYEKIFMPRKPEKVVYYGIAFYKKQCRVKMEVE
ncbi:hypothetical protein P261_02168 [Lachnospiraceae bacterium TWA4]|nr:hypothetical protein P261_02168 [Lachnospiraceae bacterium TWA4]